MRTSGAGNEHFMTLAMLAVALGVSVVLCGGPAEFAAVVDRVVRDVVQEGLSFLASR